MKLETQYVLTFDAEEREAFDNELNMVYDKFNFYGEDPEKSLPLLVEFQNSL